MSDEKYAIKRILKARRVEGKRAMEYLVDWEPTWVFEENMDVGVLDDYHMSIEVLGPIYSPGNLQKSSIKYMDLVIQRRYRQDTGSVILEIMPYEQVKELYAEELFAYIENTFSLPEELCVNFEGTSGANKSPKGRDTNGAKKLSRKRNSSVAKKLSDEKKPR